MQTESATLATVTPWWKKSRRLSVLEFLLGTFIVIGHNVYHIVPNEVPILFVLGWISIRLRDGGWKAVGLKRPGSWTWTILIALGAAALRVLLGEYVVEPLGHHFWPVAPEVSAIKAIDAKSALLWLGIIWTFAAFGEELGYRGYLLMRAADLGKRSTAAYWLGVIAVSVLFGLGHYYKGPTGMVSSGVAGLVLGGAYLISKRNMWVPILAHGFIDTIAVAAAFFGWQ